MRTLPDKYLSEIPIEENIYKVDLVILEKYQSFSAELLRLSLISLAGYGFLIVNVIFKISANNVFVFYHIFIQNKIVLVSGAFSLGFSAIAALLHRYYSTDCLTHHVRKLRMRQRLNLQFSAANGTKKEKSLKVLNGNEIYTEASLEEYKDGTSIDESIEKEAASLRKDLRACKWLLLFSIFCLFIGILHVAWYFSIILFSDMPPPLHTPPD